MKQAALDRARAHAREAQLAADFLKVATEIEPAERAWTTLLIEGQRVFSKLFAGAKGNGKSWGWAGRLKHERKSDELLQYMHQARHADEHGIARVTIERAPSLSFSLTDPSQGGFIEYIRDDGNTIEYRGAKNVDIENLPRRLELVTVINEGVSYAPPRTHLGQPWIERAPARIAAAFMAYIDAKLAEAATYVE